MIDKTMGKEIEGLSLEELEAQTGEHLPDREEMSLVNANVAAPVNTAIALNLFSDHSTAIANANQFNDIQQGNFVEQDDFGHNGMQYGHDNGNMQNGFEQSNVNVAAPTNTAVAANVFSDDSIAVANANQFNDIQQGNFVEQNDFMEDYR